MFPLQKRHLFQNELLQMKNNNFIDEITYEKVYTASTTYYENMAEEFRIEQESLKKVTMEKKQESISKRKEDSTERKASALLNLGVFFLFLSGLIFATTNWSNMELFGKVIAVIFMGSILFSGSYIAETRMSLKKTGYALWVLATLYIPIVGITFMYSLVWTKGTTIGEPTSLLGLSCISIISALVNFLSIKKYQRNYYLWATYITVELSLLFFAGGLELGFTVIFLLLVLSNLVILYIYKLLKSEQYKIYTSQYLKALSYLVLIVAILSSNSNLNIIYIFAILLLFLALLITSIILNDRFIGISSIIYLFIKTLLIFNTQHIDIKILVIPAIILYILFFLNDILKIQKETASTALILSFITFNASALSNNILFSLGIIGIIVTAFITYIKKDFHKSICEIIIPFYTYILFVGVPLTLSTDMSLLQIIIIFCIGAIALSIIQLIKIDKYKMLQLGYGKVSSILLILCGLISINHIEAMILMIIALTVFELIGVYKKINSISYLINLIIGIGIVFYLTVNDYNDIWKILSIICVLALLMGVSRINIKDNKYLVSLTSVFLICSTGICYNSLITLSVISILSVLMFIYTLKTKQSENLLVFALILGSNLFLIFIKLLTGMDYDTKQILLILIEVIYAVVLSVLSSIFSNELENDERIDSLTIVAIIILSIASAFSYNSYINTLTTTLGSLALIGFNTKKLNKSSTLKAFLVLRLIFAYIEIILLSKINFGDGILIIPMLVWAVASRYWVFKNKKSGTTWEMVSLILLNLKILSNVFNFDLVSSAIVITLGVIILVISYSKRIKIYFVTSLIMIIPALFKSTIDFWILIPWWAYLLILGATLLILGSLAEKKGTNIKDIKNKFFKDWN